MAAVMSRVWMVVLLFCHQGRLAQTGTGSGIFINVPNHGIVTLEEIGTSSTKALQCQTTEPGCCSNTDTNTGDWFSPSNATLPNTTSSNVYQAKGPGYVHLQRNNGGMEGIYRCEIGPDGNKDVYHIGLYSRGNGVPVISGEIEFELLSARNAATPVFSLSCTSTDGPATTVVWTRDDDVVPNDSNHVFSQTLINAQTAQYSNTLTVTGERPGNYQCSVSNDRNVENPTTQTLTVEATNPPTDISAIQDDTTVTVSWTPPTTGATPNGYAIYYHNSGDQGSVVIEDGTAKMWNIIGRQVNRVYTITIVTLSNQLPSSETAAVTAIRPVAYIELDGRVLPNNSLVTLPEIGTTEATSLRCGTARADCCSEGSRGSGDSTAVEWLNPRGGEGTQLNTFNYTWAGEGDPVGYVQLIRSSSSATLSTADEGIYSCIIPEPGSDPNPDIVTFYVGIYSDGCQLNVSGDIMFNQPDPQASTFTLTCTSTGCPATAVVWTKNGARISIDNHHTFSQTVVNSQTAQYSNTLTVTGKRPGNYQCNVSNDQGSAVSAIFEGIVPSAPEISSNHNDRGASILISSQTASVPILKFLVFYNRPTGADQVGCKLDDYGTWDVSSTVTEYSLDGLEEFSTYNLNAVALNFFGSSELSDTLLITTDPTAPTGAPNAVEITGQEETSITIKWDEVLCQNRNSIITHYTVEYSSDSSNSVNVANQSTTIRNLDPSTEYSIRIAAVNKFNQRGPFSSAVIAKTKTKSSDTNIVPIVVPSLIGGVATIILILAAIIAAVYFFRPPNKSGPC